VPTLLNPNFATDVTNSFAQVGQVTYAGNPPVVNKNVTGLGSLSKKESGGS
jgi:hypothetical protein